MKTPALGYYPDYNMVDPAVVDQWQWARKKRNACGYIVRCGCKTAGYIGAGYTDLTTGASGVYLGGLG